MKTTILMTLILGLSASTTVAAVTEVVEWEFPIDADGRVSVDNVNGDIEVRGDSGSTVRIVATKKADNEDYLRDMEIVIDNSERGVRVETRHPKSNGWGWNRKSGSVSYELSVPRGVELDGIDTVNGDIRVIGVAGNVRTETVNGDIEADGLESDFQGDTVNGTIEATFARVGESQRITGDTVNGRITFNLPREASVDINVDTVNGSIDADDFGLEASKGFIGRDLKGVVGRGDARLTADTVNGAVKIRSL